MFSLHKWIKISFLNFLIVAACGIILRYKILFPLTFISQKFLLHAHSHFAFTGWVSQMLFCFLVYYLQNKGNVLIYTKYKKLLMANLIIAYGMFISFVLQGYGFYSILFSTLSIIISAVFAIQYWRDLNRMNDKTITSFCCKTALFFAQLSAAGTLMLALLMATKVVGQKLYIAAIYFFLHFQYNGWFLFGCLAILFMVAPQQYNNNKLIKNACVTLAISCIPAYLLSILNFKIPVVVYVIAALAALVQLGAILWILRKMKKMLQTFQTGIAWLYRIISLAVVLKFVLQALSAIPALSKLVFGSRSVVIAYLHLVLLCIVSLFLIASVQVCIKYKKQFTTGIIIFLTGAIGNEILLTGQGVSAFLGHPLPYTNEMLLGMVLLIFIGIATMTCTVWKHKKTSLLEEVFFRS